ncbi:MAG: hypothetical protein JJU16_03020 [Alkalibacterium sp.]|nr:hypothetical protein [Alkalibacterium sp.]
MAAAYILMTNGGHPMPFAIYEDDKIIGFFLIVYGITSYDIPEIAEGNYSILKFMIDENIKSCFKTLMVIFYIV